MGSSRSNRPLFIGPDGKVTDIWKATYRFRVEHPKYGVHEYIPTAKGLDFHESDFPNCLIEGSRGTGKSMIIRNDAHMRAMAVPGFNYLIVRRTIPELKKSHLKPHFLPREMNILGGTFNKTDNIAFYPNGSVGYFSHCETEEDMMKLLGSEYDAIYFDEITTFTWSMITKIGSCLRVREDSLVHPILRGGTNPIGVGASEVRSHFITKDVPPEEDPDYNPDEYESIHTTLDDNPYINKERYIKQLQKLPAHIRKAWLDGEWIVEDAYFYDFKPSRANKPWHVTDTYPSIKETYYREPQPRMWHPKWIKIYRAIDWGFSPDPCVCLWIAVLPNGRAFVFKEETWRSTTAKEVAQDIVKKSEGMKIVETFCDPSMFYGSEATDKTAIGNIFEMNGVPLTPSVNNREQAGFAIHEYLNTVLDDELPKIQIYAFGCAFLVRTIPEMRTHKTNPRKIADGNDHWVIALAYFCMGIIGFSREDVESNQPRWMKKKASNTRPRMGSESVKVGRSGRMDRLGNRRY